MSIGLDSVRTGFINSLYRAEPFSFKGTNCTQETVKSQLTDIQKHRGMHQSLNTNTEYKK